MSWWQTLLFSGTFENDPLIYHLAFLAFAACIAGAVMLVQYLCGRLRR